MGILVLVSTGNCHLLDATSFVPLLLSSLAPILTHLLYTFTHSLTHFPFSPFSLYLSYSPTYTIYLFFFSKRILFRSDSRKAPTRARAFSKAFQLSNDSRLETNEFFYLVLHYRCYNIFSSSSSQHTFSIHPACCNNCGKNCAIKNTRRSLLVQG